MNTNNTSTNTSTNANTSTKTIEQLFNDKIPHVLATAGDKLTPCAGSVYNFHITGPGGGQWTLNMTFSPPTCAPGLSKFAQASVEMSGQDFQNILVQPNLATQLYFQGKLKVTGNPALVLKLQPLFALIA